MEEAPKLQKPCHSTRAATPLLPEPIQEERQLCRHEVVPEEGDVAEVPPKRFSLPRSRRRELAASALIPVSRKSAGTDSEAGRAMKSCLFSCFRRSDHASCVPLKAHFLAWGACSYTASKTACSRIVCLPLESAILVGGVGSPSVVSAIPFGLRCVVLLGSLVRHRSSH